MCDCGCEDAIFVPLTPDYIYQHCPQGLPAKISHKEHNHHHHEEEHEKEEIHDEKCECEDCSEELTVPPLESMQMIVKYVFDENFNQTPTDTPFIKLERILDYFKSEDGEALGIQKLQKLRGSNKRFTMMHYCCSEMDRECISLLLQHGFDINCPENSLNDEASNIFFFQRRTPLQQMIIDRSTASGSMMFFVTSAATSATINDVDYGEDAGDSSFHKQQVLNVVKTIVEKCMELDISLDLNQTDGIGETIFHYLCTFDDGRGTNAEILDYLLKKRQELKEKAQNDQKCVKFLNSFLKFDINQDCYGVTPLTRAKLHKLKACEEVLIKFGAIELKTEKEFSISDTISLPAVVKSGYVDLYHSQMIMADLNYCFWINPHPKHSVPMFEALECCEGLAAQIILNLDDSQNLKILKVRGIICEIVDQKEKKSFKMITNSNLLSKENKEFFLKNQKLFGFSSNSTSSPLFMLCKIDFDPSKRYNFVVTKLEPILDSENAQNLFENAIKQGNKKHWNQEVVEISEISVLNKEEQEAIEQLERKYEVLDAQMFGGAFGKGEEDLFKYEEIMSKFKFQNEDEDSSLGFEVKKSEFLKKGFEWDEDEDEIGGVWEKKRKQIEDEYGV